ncbi:MAG TPA: hypothetical protein VH877_08930 [Polyangia bacterium]|jgi:hypothetical protein|nr:hypothetical protein [Polyangia bacterium]
MSQRERLRIATSAELWDQLIGKVQEHVLREGGDLQSHLDATATLVCLGAYIWQHAAGEAAQELGGLDEETFLALCRQLYRQAPHRPTIPQA